MLQYYQKVSDYLIYIILIIFKIYCAGDIELLIGMMMCYTIINFFILFYRPTKTDVCDTCTELKLAIGRGGPI